jgi:diacylglycerol O-acyltransferase / wax synthase
LTGAALSGLDGAFLAAETSRQPLHAAMAAVVDTSAMAEPYSFERFREWTGEEVGRQPLLRRRVVELPYGLDHPRWVEEPEVDLDAHLTRVALAPGAGLAELRHLASDFVSRPLDRGKPLWEARIVEGLGRHRVGVLCKVHHAAVDGVSAALTMAELVDGAAGKEEAMPPAGRGRATDRRATDGRATDERPSGLELVGSGLASLLRLPVQLAEALPPVVAGVSRLGRGTQGPGGMAATPFHAPRTAFNGSLSPHRQVATATFRLADVRRVGRAFGVTVNDVILAVCSGALRRHLGPGRDLPEAPLVALVPVSARDGYSAARGGGRAAGAPGTAGANRLSALLLPLPTNRADPAARLRAVAEAAGQAKAGQAALGAGTLMALAEVGRPALYTAASRLYSWLRLADRLPPLCNLVVSNVAGPRRELSFRGVRARALYPLGPLVDGVGLNITVFSHANRLDVGLVACPELLPDLDGLAGELAPALRELVAR